MTASKVSLRWFASLLVEHRIRAICFSDSHRSRRIYEIYRMDYLDRSGRPRPAPLWHSIPNTIQREAYCLQIPKTKTHPVNLADPAIAATVHLKDPATAVAV